jgi:hypothetical protein
VWTYLLAGKNNGTAREKTLLWMELFSDDVQVLGSKLF